MTAGILAALLAAPLAALVAPAHADGIYAVALGENGVGGVLDYARGSDGALAGRFAYCQGSGAIHRETARPTSPASGFVGTYQTTGSIDGSAYKGSVYIGAAGSYPSEEVEFYTLNWDNGDLGFGVASRTLMTVAFGMPWSGLIFDTGGAIELRAFARSADRISKLHYRLDGPELVGTHRMEPVSGGNADTVTISRNGESLRLDLAGGMTGVAYRIAD